MDTGTITNLLGDIKAGKQRGDLARERHAHNALVDLVYGELKSIAERALSKESHRNGAAATTLVHEAYINLGSLELENREHLFGAAHTAMRRILIDRSRKGGKRGARMVPLEQHAESDSLRVLDAPAFSNYGMVDFEPVLNAIDVLAALDETDAEIVRRRFFAGMSMPEIARGLGMTTAEVDGRWRSARAYLLVVLAKQEGFGSNA